jgi:hypothetical protein
MKKVSWMLFLRSVNSCASKGCAGPGLVPLCGGRSLRRLRPIIDWELMLRLSKLRARIMSCKWSCGFDYKATKEGLSKWETRRNLQHQLIKYSRIILAGRE